MKRVFYLSSARRDAAESAIRVMSVDVWNHLAKNITAKISLDDDFRILTAIDIKNQIGNRFK
jgi:hypothetical protein